MKGYIQEALQNNCILAICLFLTTQLAFANQSIVLLDDPHNVYPLDAFIEVLEDKSNGISFQQASSGDLDNRFVANESGIPNYGFSNSAYWVRFKVLNDLDENKNWLLEISQPQLNSIKLFYNKPDGSLEIKTTGDHYPFDQREISHPFFLIPLELQHQQITTFYVRVSSKHENVSLPLRIVPMKTFSEQDGTIQYLLGLYYGLLLMVIFINLFLYTTGNGVNNLYYVFYIIGIGLLQFSLNGLTLKYLITDSVFWGNHINIIAASFAIITILIFTKSFLNTRLYIPKQNKFINIVLVIAIINFVIAFIPDMYAISYQMIHYLAILSNVMVFAAAVVTFMKGFKPARFFIIAFFFLIVGVFLYIFKNFGVLPDTILTENGIQIGSGFQVVLLSFALADRIKILKERQERSQKETKKRLETKVKERTLEVTRQKEIIEAKNKDITDSINYAQKIQETILPNKSNLKDVLPESFIYYVPKDIVSGDFYWFAQTRAQELILVAMDCTGHGVPGAFMSMIGNDSLNHIIIESMITDPAEILDKMNKRVTKILKQKDERTTTRDGMDMSLCKIDLATGKVTFSGANRPLYVIREQQLIIQKGDKYSIGGHDMINKTFTNKEVILEKGDMVYMFSDGYPDQFGGKNNRKFMTRRFKSLLTDMAHLDILDQENKLDDNINQWKGDHEQIDDMLVIGFRFT